MADWLVKYDRLPICLWLDAEQVTEMEFVLKHLELEFCN